MEMHSYSKPLDTACEEKFLSDIPSHILCEVLHVQPEQILVKFQWNEITYNGLLWNISKR